MKPLPHIFYRHGRWWVKNVRAQPFMRGVNAITWCHEQNRDSRTVLWAWGNADDDRTAAERASGPSSDEANRAAAEWDAGWPPQ